MRLHQIAFLLLLAAQAAMADGDIPFRSDEFNKQQLMRSSSLQLINPANFSMRQSYSMQFVGTSLGTQNSGVYLNTISYKFGIPLTLSMDVGLYNLFYSSAALQQANGMQGSANKNNTKPDILFPSISLDYRPTNNLLFCLQVVNMRDAYKAYGPNYYWGSSFLHPGSGW